MKRVLIRIGIVFSAILVLLVWASMWLFVWVFGPWMSITPSDRTMTGDPTLFHEADTIDYAGVTFVVPAEADAQLFPEFEKMAGCRICWDSVYAMVIIDRHSAVVSSVWETRERSMYARWHPFGVVGKAMTLQGLVRELWRVETPFMAGYGWVRAEEGTDRYHYELTDGKVYVTFLITAGHSPDDVATIENMIALVRPSKTRQSKTE